MGKLENNKGKDIIILGMGLGFDKCTYNPDKEVWTFGLGYLKSKRTDKLFLLEPMERINAMIKGFYLDRDKDKKIIEVPITIDDMKKNIKDNNIDFISGHEYKDMSCYRPYPFEEIVKNLGVPYFTDHITYMIAYAIATGVKSIELWGINLPSSADYIQNKACLEFWIGMALGMGIMVHINGDGTSLLKNQDGFLFGYRMPIKRLLDNLKDGELKPPKLL